MASQIFGPRPDHGEQPIPTKHEREEYHDFLEKFMELDEFISEIDEETRTIIEVVRDTLCWTLGHPNGAFEINMQSWSDFYKDVKGLHDSYKN